MEKGKFVIVRTSSAGVHAGNLELKEGREVTLTDAIRLWYWSGAFTLSQIASEGVKDPTNCKFSVPVKEIILLEAIEILSVSILAEKNIKSVLPCRMN